MPVGDFVPDDDFLGRLSEVFGPSSLTLEIGPLRFSLDGLSSDQAIDLARRYQPFVTQGSGPVDLSIRFLKAGVPAFLALPVGASEVYRMGTRSAGGRMTLWSYEFAGWIESPSGRAVLALVRSEGEWFDRGLENFLRVATASFMVERGGFLLHASCVVRGGRAYVFFGPSGSGKTTVTWLSPGNKVLSDDLTLVVPGRDGYEAAGIPFGMAHHRTPDTNASFPIASFNRLVQSPSVAREKIDGARALAELAGSIPFVMQDTGQAEKAITVAGRALRSVQAYRLKFRKDDTFWSLIEEA